MEAEPPGGKEGYKKKYSRPPAILYPMTLMPDENYVRWETTLYYPCCHRYATWIRGFDLKPSKKDNSTERIPCKHQVGAMCIIAQLGIS